jgi:hypothetical protein
MQVAAAAQSPHNGSNSAVQRPSPATSSAHPHKLQSKQQVDSVDAAPTACDAISVSIASSNLAHFSSSSIKAVPPPSNSSMIDAAAATAPPAAASHAPAGGALFAAARKAAGAMTAAASASESAAMAQIISDW